MTSEPVVPGHAHVVEFGIRKNGPFYGMVSCRAKSGARCRLTCPEGCPTWPCQHQLVDGGECNIVTYLNSEDLALFYHGEEAPLKNGPIVTKWDATYECYTWSFAP